MSFEILLCCAIAIWALLNFVVLPRFTAAWNASHLVSKVAKAGALAAVQFVRDVCLVASILYICFALLTFVLRFGYFGNVELLKWAVDSASGLHESFERVSDFTEHWFFLVPVAMLIYLQWERQKKDYSRRFERYVDGELDRLNEERRKEPQKWNQFEADQRIRNLDEEIAKAQTSLQSLLQKGSKDKTERRGLLRQIVALKEERTEWDYQRRIDLERLNVQQDSSIRRPACLSVLLSKGLFSDLQGFSQVLSRTTLALLTVALIGVAGDAGLTKEVYEGVIHLDELRVEARKEEAKKSWENHPRTYQPSTQDQGDNQATRQLAYDFGRAFARNPNWQALRPSARSEEIYNRAVARRAILTEVRLPDAQGQSREAFVSGFNRNEADILHAAVYTSDTSSAHVAPNRIGQIIEERHGPEIKSWFGEKWASLQVAIHDHAQSYYEPVNTDDLQGELIDRIVAAAFDATEAPGTSDVLKQARDGMSDATKEAVREAVETEFELFVNDLHEGKSYEESVEKVRKDDIPISKGKVDDLATLIHDRNLPDRRDFHDRVVAGTGEWKDPNSPDHPPFGNNGPGNWPSSGGGGIPTNGPDRGGTPEGTEPSPGSGGPMPPPSKSGSPGGSVEGESIVDDIAKRTTSDGARSLQEEQVGALADYEDHFPRSVASQSSTPLGQLLARYRVAEDASAFARVAEMNVARASSFTMLRGFSKVGGVLIGREPKGTADIRDIRWTKSGRDVKIGLIYPTGKESWFGPFDISLVHQSLAYAADGRPVAVTMTIARPVTGLKVFLHPALLDTPLGCRVQQLDRLVDTYAGEQLPERRTISEQYLDQVAAYNAALAKRMEAVAEKLDQSSGWKPAAQQMAAEYAPEAEKGLNQPDLFSESSIMRRKPEFFEPSLIKTMKSCRKDNLAAFESCVLETYRDSRFVREFKKDYLRTWSYEPASIEPWSGVRERDYQITNDLGFLQPPEGATLADRLWPFDFMVQIAFTSPAVNLPEKEQEVYVDRQPVEFTQIQDKIARLVDDGIHRDHFDSQFKDLRDFAVLQRLFRAALNGNFGDKFPTLKLAQLTKDTADEAPYFHTRRWNSSSRLAFDHWAQQAFFANDNGQSWIKVARVQLQSCAKSVSAAYEGQVSASLSSACNFAEYSERLADACPDLGQDSPACSWRKFTILAHREVTEAAFGVLDDERKNSPTADCPPLTSSTLTTALR
jgi:hypothetical protein